MAGSPPAADAVDLEAAVCGYLTHGYAPLDATVTAHAWNAVDCPGSLAELDELTGTYKLFGNARPPRRRPASSSRPRPSTSASPMATPTWWRYAMAMPRAMPR